MIIGVYYIATGDYKALFLGFVKSLKHFMPEAKKVVQLISDGLEDWDRWEADNVVVHLCPRINHYPWPVVTLYKHWHILQNWDPVFDYVCYFNANAEVYENNGEWFEHNKVICSYHSFNGKDHAYDPWYAININQSSTAYLQNRTYDYVQAAFFFGPANLIHKMCEDIVNDLLFRDTQKHIYPQWHDESYLNKWCTMNEEFVVRKYLMSVYVNALSDTTFIFMRNKGNIINDFKTKPAT